MTRERASSDVSVLEDRRLDVTSSIDISLENPPNFAPDKPIGRNWSALIFAALICSLGTKWSQMQNES